MENVEVFWNTLCKKEKKKVYSKTEDTCQKDMGAKLKQVSLANFEINFSIIFQLLKFCNILIE